MESISELNQINLNSIQGVLNFISINDWFQIEFQFSLQPVTTQSSIRQSFINPQLNKLTKLKSIAVNWLKFI